MGAGSVVSPGGWQPQNIAHKAHLSDYLRCVVLFQTMQQLYVYGCVISNDTTALRLWNWLWNLQGVPGNPSISQPL